MCFSSCPPLVQARIIPLKRDILTLDGGGAIVEPPHPSRPFSVSLRSPKMPRLPPLPPLCFIRAFGTSSKEAAGGRAQTGQARLFAPSRVAVAPPARRVRGGSLGVWAEAHAARCDVQIVSFRSLWLCYRSHTNSYPFRSLTFSYFSVCLFHACQGLCKSLRL